MMSGKNIAIIWISIVAFALILTILSLYLLPKWNVYQRTLQGRAALQEAEWNRKIAVEEAEATKASATLLAEAEVIRAEGVKKANEIIANGLGGAEGYLRYLYIQALSTNEHNDIIYIPTEAGLPILEAQRLPIKFQR